ncbi:MAG: type II/IV secretion system protein [Elusimicrobia bacterium]|nr:type II/IV secretion system protein [Elusimicrobiota bacterium]
MPEPQTRLSHRQDIEEILAKTGYPQERIEKARLACEENSLPLAQNLLALSLATLDELCDYCGKFYKTTFIPIPETAKTYFHIVPRNIILRYQVLPLGLDGRTMTLGMVNPKDVEAADDVSFLTGYDVNPVGILEMQFDQFIKEQASVSSENINLKQVLRDVAETRAGMVSEKTGVSIVGTSDSAIQKFIKTMVSDAMRNRASDIHIEPQETILLLRYRIDGFLRTAYRIPLGSHAQIISALKILANLDITETRRPQDGRITIKVDNRSIDMRIATILTHYGENVVIRILDTKNIKVGMNDLGIPDYVQARLKELGLQNTGMLLVTGPTGSGKTTTLYSFIQTIRSPALKIITLEDPIEYPILEDDRQQEGGITQIQVNPKVNLTFSAGLRAALRLDPDIIFVGEIRDLETAEISFSAALTGRLVLSTLHTNDAPSTVTRLLDMQIDPFLIAGALRAVMSQRLVRKLCQECRVRYEPPARTMDRLAQSLPKEVVLSIVPTLYRPHGCKTCGGRGYSGRIGLFELLEINDELRDLILNRAPISEILRAAQNTGLRTLRTAGLIEVLKGRTTLAEVFRVTPAES